jgi:surface polysaccharide O-acyltransferase-like enzyme
VWLRGRQAAEGAFRWLRKPLGPLLLMLPTLVTEFALRARWPGYQNLVDDWANFTLYLWFFVAGYLIVSDRGVRARIRAGRRAWLALALPPTLLIVAVVTVTGQRVQFAYDDPLYGGFVLAVTVAAWGWVLAAWGYGAVWLNQPTDFLRQVAYPFYIVHQGWVVLLAFYVVPLGWSVAGQFAAIALGTVLLSAASAELIRRVPGVRLLFGVKGGRPHDRPYLREE